ncbi:hypothetical protein ABZ260_14170 [Streptosporangium sp. NPDC006013]
MASAASFLQVADRRAHGHLHADGAWRAELLPPEFAAFGYDVADLLLLG